MEYQSDNFVTYTETTVPPNESFPDLDFMLQSPFTDSSGGQSYSHETNSQFQNHSVSHHSFGSPYASPEDQRTSKAQKRRQKTSNPESEYTMGENNERNLIDISSQSKKIQKRDKAKARAKIKQNMAMVMAVAPEKYIPSGIDDPNLDDKTKRKMIQMAKNRMAAQKTRDRKKQYTSELEEVKNHLAKVNEELEEKNRLLEEKIRALEMNQVYLLQENQELKQKQFLETFYQPNVETLPSSIDTGSGFDSNSEYKSLPSPAGLSRRSSRGTNNYFNFFLGVIAICAVYTGINIKIGQESENLPDPFKDQIEEWTMEGFQPPEIMKSEVEPMLVEETPATAKTFAGKKKDESGKVASTVRRSSKRDDGEKVESVRTVTTSSFAPRAPKPDDQPVAMSAMSISASDSVGSGYQYGTMMASSMMMDMMEGGAYQPKTPIKSRWDFASELYNLRHGLCSQFDAPGYVWKAPQPKTPVKSRWDFVSELYDLRYGMSYKWDAPGHVWDEPYIVSGEYDDTYDSGEMVFLNDDGDLYQEDHRGLNENMAVQAA